MPEAGFFAQRRNSPTGFALVVAGHAAALTALALAKAPEYVFPPRVITKVRMIELPDPPPPNRVEQPRRPEQPSRMTVEPTPTPLRPDFPALPQDPFPTRFDTRTAGADNVEIARVEPITPSIRREAELIPRDLQPPYPTAEQRAQRNGTVRIRITIGADGRVTAVRRVSATSDAFWRVTERQALSRWRFRPATLDGRPVETSKVMTVTFRIDEA